MYDSPLQIPFLIFQFFALKVLLNQQNCFLIDILTGLLLLFFVFLKFNDNLIAIHSLKSTQLLLLLMLLLIGQLGELLLHIGERHFIFLENGETGHPILIVDRPSQLVAEIAVRLLDLRECFVALIVVELVWMDHARQLSKTLRDNLDARILLNIQYRVEIVVRTEPGIIGLGP